VFLFDEPLSNLDAKLRTQMRLEIKRLRLRVPATSVFVTHDQVEAMTLGDRVVVMRDGYIQQCGTPLQVYAEPANKFVAGFIGAPSMNFITARIESADGAMIAHTRALRLAVPRARASALSPWIGKEVVVGLRPEHMRLRLHDETPVASAVVEVIEQLGSEIVIEARAGDDILTIARIGPQTPLAVGDTIHLTVQGEHLHFFDPQSEQAIQ
jgi:multiple sugar transport system ATP-binding protein